VPLPPELWSSWHMTLQDLITRIVFEEAEVHGDRKEE
jgi:D-alanyl-lipoteichoic acid acyltransferase DltB (MBOAT superfamily)